MAKLGTFSEHSVVHEASLVKVDPDLPLTASRSCRAASTTGWGSAVHRAEVQPGETVVVVGVGGVGINAVQGARMAGARIVVAVDPVEFKQKAALDLGATHTAASMEEALPLVTRADQGPDGRRGHPHPGRDVRRPHGGGPLAHRQGRDVRRHRHRAAGADRVQHQPVRAGHVAEGGPGRHLRRGQPPASTSPTCWRSTSPGQLKLDELITRTYRLDQINQGYQDMLDGMNIRGVIAFD